MAAYRYVIEFQESFCRIYAWEGVRNAYALRETIVVPLHRPAIGENTQETAASFSAENGETIRQALRTAGLRCTEALAVVPKQWVTLRIVTLPSTDPTELDEMARFETERHVPFNASRHVMSHHVLRVEGLQGSRVILAALDGPLAEDAIETFKAAGIRLEGLEVSSMALANALMYGKQWNPETHPTVAHVDIGLMSSDVTIFHQGIPIFSRSIAHGVEPFCLGVGADDTELLRRIANTDLLTLDETGDGEGEGERADARKWSQTLVRQIRQTYDFAYREFEVQPLTRIFVSGYGLRLKGLDQVLASSLDIETEELNPFVGELSLSESLTAKGFAPGNCSMAVGALVRDIEPGMIKINLLPGKYIAEYTRTRRRQSQLTMGVLVLSLVVCFYLAVTETINRRESRLAYLQEQIAQAGERSQEIRYRATVVKIIRENASKKASALAVLDTIGSWDILFKDADMRVALTNLDFVTGKYVSFKGYAREHADLNTFQKQLEDSKLFKEVQLERRASKRLMSSSVNVVEFTLNCYY
jgi:Tfp pilus assembly PilM family ATPase/Tfp pilus assembly protein PilN